MEHMSFDKFLKLIAKRWKIIPFFISAFVGVLVFYGIFFYNPTYVSDSKILLKPNTSNTFVSELNSDNEVPHSLGQNKNPVLTQIEVLNSHDISLKVSKALLKEPKFKKSKVKDLVKDIQKNVHFNNPPGTDIIDITVKWDTPEDAQKISKLLLSSYYSYNESVYKKSALNTKTYIENQLKDTNNKLREIREKIQKYRKNNSSLNIDLEAENVIDRTARIEDLLTDINVNIASANRKVKELSRGLGSTMKRALDSVALGQSESLVKLNENLVESQQKLADLKVKYPQTTPQIKSLNSQIKQIESQIENETIALIGRKPDIIQKSIIADSVRSEMVDDFVKNNIELKSLLSQRAILRKDLRILRSNKNKFPNIQKALTIMQEKEKSLAAIAEILNAKLVEAKIHESALVSNIDIIEKPIFPTSKSFPTLLHLLGIFILAGTLMGIATILGLYYIEDTCDDPQELEKIIKAPILGIIPWLTNETYKNLLLEYNPHSVITIIYQKIITSLKIKCYKKKINAIGIISTELEKGRSIVSTNIATSFAKTNEKVILIDNDFRYGSLTKEFNIDFSKYPDITDLILELSKTKDPKAPIKDTIMKHIIQIPNQENMFLIPNNHKVINPYEILNNEIFHKIIQCLKSDFQFDFMIVDSPPLLAVADSIITSQYLDGLVLLCGLKTSRSDLNKIKKICDENYVELLGAVARDTLTELEAPESIYVKQLSSIAD